MKDEQEKPSGNYNQNSRKEQKRGKKPPAKKQSEEGKQDDEDSIIDRGSARYKQRKLQVEKLPMVHVNGKLKTVTSTELGFTGESTEWFDDEAYKFPK
jgi:hypothetical protein